MSSPSIYKLWLHLQCQMVADCLEGLLVKSVAGGRDRVLAHWPETAPISRKATEAARRSSSKRKMQMLRDDKTGVFLAHPIAIDGEYWGTVVVHIPHHKPALVQAVLKLLKWGFTWLRAVSQLTAPSSSHESDGSNKDQKQLLELLSRALKEQTTEETAITTVNHIAQNFGFSRASLGLMQNGKLKLQAISRSAQFDPSSDIAKSILETMHEALSQDADISYPADSSSNTTNRYHQSLAQGHQQKSTHSLILRTNDRVTGVLTLEDSSNARMQDSTRGAISQSLEPIAGLISLKTRPISAPDNRWRRFLPARLIKLRTLEGLLAGFLLVLAAVSLVPADYKIKSRAVLQSTNSHVVVTPFDGYLADILVKPGDTVSPGQTLAHLKNEDLKLEQRRLHGQLQQYQLEYDNALAEGDRAQAAISNAQIDQARAALELVAQQLQRTTLRTPVEGTVVSDDIRQSAGAPTARGDVLFEIADIRHYDVQVYIAESDIGHVHQGQSGELILNSLPGQVFDITVNRITPISEVKDGRNYFKVEARLTRPTDVLRPGMTGSAKIHIEQRALGWIWFHDAWYWLRRVLWV